MIGRSDEKELGVNLDFKLFTVHLDRTLEVDKPSFSIVLDKFPNPEVGPLGAMYTARYSTDNQKVISRLSSVPELYYWREKIANAKSREIYEHTEVIGVTRLNRPPVVFYDRQAQLMREDALARIR